MAPSPDVLIIFATDFTGGPGRGLVQLIENAPSFEFNFTLCNFNATYVKGGNRRFYEAAEESGIHVHSMDQYFPIDPTVLLRALSAHKQYGSNIIQTHGYKPSVIGLFLKTIRKVPWIAFAHGYTDDDAKVRIYNRLDTVLLRYADRVVAVSNSMRELLMRKGINPSKITVVPNAIDKDALTPDVCKSAVLRSLRVDSVSPVIGVVGRLGPEKGQLLFLRAFQRVLQDIVNVKALIIGDGPDRRALERFCLENHIEESVRFVGHVQNIANYYQLLDLMVIPSISEGLPNALLEAMSFRVPVIATAVGGIPEVIDDGSNGILVPSGSPRRMADEIVKLVQDGEQQALFAENGEKTVLSHYQPEARVGNIYGLYKEVLMGI